MHRPLFPTHPPEGDINGWSKARQRFYLSMSMNWNTFRIADNQNANVRRISSRLNISMPAASLLVRRGIADPSAARRFLSPRTQHLHDPFLFPDMRRAVALINRAFVLHHTILVYGDYDVDGCTAVALVYDFLRKYHAPISYYIPSRYSEGYGLTPKAVEYIREKGFKLLIILDTGIKSLQTIAQLAEEGISTIVCDHHQTPEGFEGFPPNAFQKLPDEEEHLINSSIPDIAILNPLRKDNTYPYTHLSGCGIGFKLLQAFSLVNGIPFQQLRPRLDLCAIAAAADLVPLTGENRVIVKEGLKIINTNTLPGIKAILQTALIQNRNVTMEDITYKIGPRINAAGRLTTGMETVSLLIEQDEKVALQKAHHINYLNETRKDLDKTTTEEAMNIVRSMPDLDRRKTLVLYKPTWNKGIIGIIASRIAETFYKPTIVLTLDENGLATGSARSVAGFDIYTPLSHLSDLLSAFGGHTYAVGLTLEEKNVEELCKQFENQVKEHILPRQTIPSLNIDLQLSFSDITPDFVKTLQLFEPFGPGNPRPTFCTEKVYDFGGSKVVGRTMKHLKLELLDQTSPRIIRGIAYNLSSLSSIIKSRQPFNIAYNINTHASSSNDGNNLINIVDIRPDSCI